VKKIFLFLSALFSTASLLAQDSTASSSLYQQNNAKAAKRERENNMLRMEEEGDLIFNKDWMLGFRFATDGYGIFFEKGKYKTNSKTFIWQLELNEKKSPKDHKVAAAGYNGYDFSSVVVGKLNNFYAFKAAVGQQFLIGGKGNRNGVAVTALYSGGFSLGILKPYFVNVEDPSTGNTFRSKYPTIIDSGYVELGAAGFFVGWSEAWLKPGVNAKLAMRFDYGRFNQTISAIEAGVTGEYYFTSVPMLYDVAYKNLFLNAYVSIMFGKRK
jgi:hypothetical protein